MNILVVDDNKAVRDKLETLLIAQGHSVGLANNGLDALGKAQQSTYHLFIIDHLMPLMNGIQLTKNIKNNTLFTDVPIIFMTTQGVATLEHLAEFSFFDKVIDKPINEIIFLESIAALGNIEIETPALKING